MLQFIAKSLGIVDIISPLVDLSHTVSTHNCSIYLDAIGDDMTLLTLLRGSSGRRFYAGPL